VPHLRKAEMYASQEGVVKSSNFDPMEYRRVALEAQGGKAAGAPPKLREGVNDVFHMNG
jgi:hypothetical protein